MRDALRMAADVEALFGVKADISSDSPWGSLPVRRRRVVVRKEYGPAVEWPGHDEATAAVLTRYGVGDVRRALKLFGV